MASKWSERRRARQDEADRPGDVDPIGSLYAYLVAGDGQCEAIVASVTPAGVTPLVAADRPEADRMEVLARRAADGSRMVIRLVRFDRARVVATIRPDPIRHLVGSMVRGDVAKLADGRVPRRDRPDPPLPPGLARVRCGKLGGLVAIGVGEDDYAMSADEARKFAESILAMAAEIAGPPEDGRAG